ncbi:hypothetical protein V8C42DRAFT_336944 [Trichoderma barbatum]
MQEQKTHNSSIHQTILNASGVETNLLSRGARKITTDMLKIELEPLVESSEVKRETSLAMQFNLLNGDLFSRPRHREGDVGLRNLRDLFHANCKVLKQTF